MRSNFLCLATFASSLSACSPSGADTPSQEVACEIVTDYVGRFVNEAERLRTKYPDAPRSIAVREAPLQLLPVISEDGPIEGSVPKSIAHVGDWRSVTKLPEQSVLDACISLEPLLSEQGVVSDNETINSLTIGDDWDAHVLLVAMPIWTVDQEHAVIFARKSTGGLSGVGILAIYSKSENGEWQFAREEVRSIS